jgi:hypothetical protein
MLGRGNFLVSTSRGHLTDVVDLPPGGSLLVVLTMATGRSRCSARRRLAAHGLAAPSHKSLLELHDRLVYRMPPSRPTTSWC